MDLITSFLAPLFFALSTITFISLLLNLITKQKLKLELPPGPPQLPIIGNLHQVKGEPHIALADIAKTYGPLISLRFGKQLVVIASSPEAAMGVLKTQDQLLSSRVVPTVVNQPHLLPHSLMWSDSNQTWKTLRSLCRTELFSASALATQSRLRNEKISQLLDFLHQKQGEVINVEDALFITLFNTLSSIILGKDLLDFNADYGNHHGLKKSLHDLLGLGGNTIDLASFYPILERFDLHGIKKEAKKHMDSIFSSWEDIIEERRAQVNSPAWSSDQAHSFLDRLLEKRFSNSQINQLITELFTAGSNTTTSTVIWAMSEIVRHQEVASKIEEEMKMEIISHDTTNNQRTKSSYLQACIKETFRMHPPVPLLLPHKAAETCEVMNYTIPKNAKVFVNAWAIGRDPKIWNEPLSFQPERFINSKLDYKGQDFELIPFGSGRRMCPGMPSGIRSVEFILASLIREFDWELPNGEDPAKLDMNEKFGIAVKREKPLMLIFKQKQAYAQA